MEKVESGERAGLILEDGDEPVRVCERDERPIEESDSDEYVDDLPKDPYESQEEESSKVCDGPTTLFLLCHSPRTLIAIILFVATAGVCTGWNGLKLIMIDEKMFHNLCTSHDTGNTTISSSHTCNAQTQRMNSIYSFSVAMINLGSPLLGAPLDYLNKKYPKHGLRLAFYPLFTLSLTLLALVGVFVKFRVLDNATFVINVLYAGVHWTGAGIFILFLKSFMKMPRHLKSIHFLSGLTNSLFVGSWDLSSGIFFLFYVCYYYLKVDILVLFLVYCGFFYILYFLYGLFFRVPQKYYLHPVEDLETQHENEKNHEIPEPGGYERIKEEEEQEEEEEKRDESNSEEDDEEYYSHSDYEKKNSCGFWSGLGKSVCTPAFFILLFWKVTSNLATYFFSCTVYEVALWLSHGNVHVSQYHASLFSWILPLGSFLCPLFGFFVGKYKNGSSIMVLVFSVGLGCFYALPWLGGKIVGYTMLMVVRVLNRIVFYQFCKENLNFSYFATLITLFKFVLGICILIILPLNQYLVFHVFNGSFFIVNICMASMMVFGNVFLLILASWNARKSCLDHTKKVCGVVSVPVVSSLPHGMRLPDVRSKFGSYEWDGFW